MRSLQGWLLSGLLFLTLVVFANVGGHEFVHFDDNINIYENPHLKGLSAESLKWMFTDTGYARRYMPLGWLSYATAQQLFGLNPRAFHVLSLLLHLANLIVLFFLLKRLLLLASASARERAVLWCAAAGALFWAVNPLRVEVVAWASSLIYGQATLLAMLWLSCWLRAQDPTANARARRLWHVGSIAAYAASLLTYPLALFAPVVLFALEVCVLHRASLRLADWRGPEARRLWLDKLPFLAVAAVGLVLTTWARTASGEYNQPATLDEFGILPRGMQACYVWAYYLWKPWVPFDLAPVYPTLHGFIPWSWPFLVSAGLLVAVGGWLFLQRRRWPALFMWWWCHLVMLVPFLGLTERSHSPADRYSYLHGVLWSIFIASALNAGWKHLRRVQSAGLVVAVACALYGLLAWQQVPVWCHTIPLHQQLIARLDSDSACAKYHEVLGVHYLRAGLTNNAVASLQSAIRAESARKDRQGADEGILTRSHLLMGNILASLGQPVAAIEHYREALKADPNSASVSVNLGLTLAGLKRFEEAEDSFETALRHDPASVSAHHNLGTLLRLTGREEEARRHFEEVQRRLASK